MNQDTYSSSPGSVGGTPPPGQEDLRRQASAVGDDLKNYGNELVSSAKDRALSIVDEQKRAGADRTRSMAAALDAAAGELGDVWPQLARYTHDAARSVDSFSSALRERSFGELVDDAKVVTRRHPAGYFFGAMAVGFVLTRFLKSDIEPLPRSSFDSPDEHLHASSAGAPAGGPVVPPSYVATKAL